MRILIAEDSLTSRKVLETMLDKWGYDVISTVNGAEAWEAIQQEGSPRLLILDWMMPKMDGTDVCQKIREQNDSTRYIILLTAMDQKKDIVRGLEAGANDYVIKPFDGDELRARIRVGERVIQLQEDLRARVLELEDAIAHIRTLQGLLPICMHCHKIRTDEATWQKLEGYIESHTEAEFSHSLCPDCLEEHYPVDQCSGGTK